MRSLLLRGRRLDECSGLVIIAVGAARKVQDGANTVDSGVDTLTRRQIADHVLDALAWLLRTPAQHPHVLTGLTQMLHDVAPERARTTCDQNRSCHGCDSIVLPPLVTRGAGSVWSPGRVPAIDSLTDSDPTM